MKLSPNLQWKLSFWSITLPLIFPLTILVVLAIINPFWFRESFMSFVEKLARRLGHWRDEKTFVKYFYDKAHLFEKLKNSK